MPLLIVRLPSTKTQAPRGQGRGQFCSQLPVKCLEQQLLHRRCSINMRVEWANGTYYRY